MKKVFIDGSAGTTGLRIRSRLAERKDLELVTLSEELRKDSAARKDALNGCDVAFLCLPDAAAIEAVSMVENPEVTIIDTSTAHRTNDAWQYGFPELHGMREKVSASKRIANPGCHASGFVALIEPLTRAGIIAKDERLCAFSLTGYSGGGKKMIADYETQKTPLHDGGRQYALGQVHKHLPEMVKVCGLAFAPAFSPIVVPHYSGMETTVQLHGASVKGGIEAVRKCLAEYYADNGLVRYVEDASQGGFISSAAYFGRDDMAVSVFGNDERMVLVSLFDNLGKGASGAAIQNMNLVLGYPEATGLIVG